jgi:transcriptional regulator with XRE-family HTH domain
MRQKHAELIALGKRVRALREKKGLSQEAFADAVELDRSYMGRIERGENNATVLTVYRIARALRIHPAALFRS